MIFQTTTMIKKKRSRGGGWGGDECENLRKFKDLDLGTNAVSRPYQEGVKNGS